MSKIYAFVPARSGSERVTNKNLKLLKNKYLIQFTLDLIETIPEIEKTFISTDYKNLQEKLSLTNSVEIIHRPASIAKSHSLDIDWVLHLLDQLENNLPEIIILLRPTSPFRSTKFVKDAINVFLNNPEYDSSRSIKKVKEHPDKMWKSYGKDIIPYNGFNDNLRDHLHSQQYKSLEEIYVQTSSLEILRTESLIKNKKLSGKKILPIYSSGLDSFTIDYDVDFKIAELILDKKLDI